MKWIKDENPKTPGMYGVRSAYTLHPDSFHFAYFNGKGWVIASQAGEQAVPYRGTPEWTLIEWGNG